MRSRLIRKDRAVWVAFVAVALHVLWPFAAYPRPAADGLTVELCTAHGSTAVPLPGGPEGKGHVSHCALCCANSAKLLALPSTSHTSIGAAAATPDRPIARDISRARVSPYLPARPRGPPDSLRI